MFPKHARLPTRQRCNIVPCCGKNNKANNNREDSKQPPRLTPESIKALGGLKNAKRVIDKHEEISRGERSASSVSKKYRKKKKSSDEYAAEKAKSQEQERVNSQDMYQNHYGSSNPKKLSLILIDGYNLLREMENQEKDQYESVALARQRYKMEKAILAFIQGVRTHVVIVYDALDNPNKDEESNGLVKDNHDSLELIFCQDYEADKGITIMCEQYLKEGTPEITVITTDRDIRQNCSNLPRVNCKKSKIFSKEIYDRNKARQDEIDELNLTRNRNSLAGTLSHETLSELNQILRDSS